MDHWTPEAEERIVNKALSYTSAALNYHHRSQKQGGKDIGPIVNSVAATNIPALNSTYPMVATKIDITKSNINAENIMAKFSLSKWFPKLTDKSTDTEIEATVGAVFEKAGVKDETELLTKLESIKKLEEEKAALGIELAAAKKAEPEKAPGDKSEGVSDSEIKLAERVDEMERTMLSQDIDRILDDAQDKGLCTASTRETYHKLGMSNKESLVELLSKKSPEVVLGEFTGGENLDAMTLTADEEAIRAQFNLNADDMLAEKKRLAATRNNGVTV